MANILRKSVAVGGGVGAAIAAIIAGVISVEGGYVNDPRDPGGVTNYGITERVARASGYSGDMRYLTKEIASQIYYKEYVLEPKYDKIVELSPAVGEKVIDAGVNTGVGRSSRWLQTALNAFNNNGKDYSQIAVDGVVGNDTLRALGSLQNRRGKRLACELIIKSLDSQQYMHYQSLTNLKQYTVGWVDHRIGNVPLSRCADE